MGVHQLHSTSSHYDNNINAIRFFAASVVVFGHSYVLAGEAAPTIFGASVSAWAVDIFFVISGFLIAKSWTRDSNVLRYSARRFFRIFPALLCVVLFTLLIIGPLVTSLSLLDYFSDVDTWKYLVNALLIRDDVLPGVFADNPFPLAVNGSLWTLDVEVFMYVVLPIFFKCTARFDRGKSCMILMCCFAAAYAVLLYLDTQAIFHSLVIEFARLGTFFFIGALFFERGWEKKVNHQWAMIAAVLCLVFSQIDFWFGPLLLLVATPIILFPFAFPKDPILKDVFSREDFSYGIYIYAFPVQQTIVHFAQGEISPVALFIIAELVTLLLAFASWYLIEKRMLAFCRSTVLAKA